MIYNLGSINLDYVYDVPRFPKPGETLPALATRRALGGKGANMSIAAVRAGAQVRHIGAVGRDGIWARDALARYGVDIANVAIVDDVTGHAIVVVEQTGENAILIVPGANRALTEGQIASALSSARANDILLVQNETNGQDHALRLARDKAMIRLYTAAPFDETALLNALPMTDILVLNEIELVQLQAATGKDPGEFGVGCVIVTRGAEGARLWQPSKSAEPEDIPAPQVAVVDTTGAGDTFTGFLAAALCTGFDTEEAVRHAVAAASLKVARKGVADAIPTMEDVLAFLD